MFKGWHPIKVSVVTKGWKMFNGWHPIMVSVCVLRACVNRCVTRTKRMKRARYASSMSMCLMKYAPTSPANRSSSDVFIKPISARNLRCARLGSLRSSSSSVCRAASFILRMYNHIYVCVHAGHNVVDSTVLSSDNRMMPIKGWSSDKRMVTLNGWAYDTIGVLWHESRVILLN